MNNSAVWIQIFIRGWIILEIDRISVEFKYVTKIMQFKIEKHKNQSTSEINFYFVFSKIKKHNNAKRQKRLPAQCEATELTFLIIPVVGLFVKVLSK